MASNKWTHKIWSVWRMTETVRIVVEKHPHRLGYPLELSEIQPGTAYATLPHPKTEVEGFPSQRLKKLNTSLMNKKNLI